MADKSNGAPTDLIAARLAQFDPENVSSDVLSWNFEIGERTYWLPRQVGADLRWFFGVNSGPHSYTLDFVDLDTDEQTTIHLGSDATWTLTASDDDPDDRLGRPTS